MILGDVASGIAMNGRTSTETTFGLFEPFRNTLVDGKHTCLLQKPTTHSPINGTRGAT